MASSSDSKPIASASASGAVAPAVPPSAALPLKLKLIHGFGAVAFGVKDSGFSFFLLIYYNQVLGMNAGTVGYVLLAALLIDAVIDPILGNLSDRTYTKWGRRLPWLYAAPIPLAFVWVLLWSPPGGEAPTALGLLGIAATVRILLSACEVPSISLVPELTSDYDERTTLFRFRFLFGWIGGLLMMILAYTVFMPGADGLLRQEGYRQYGIFGAVLMAVAVMGSAWGQHSLVAKLPAVKPPPFSLKGAFSEIVEAFSEKAFLIFAAGGLAAYISQGMTFSISQYVNLFIWQLSEDAFKLYPLVLAASVIVMFFIVGPLHRRFGKPASATFCAIGAFFVGFTPYGLLLAGVWPDPGSGLSTALYFLFLGIANTLGIVVMISATSMVAEIVESYQERTGLRAEGAFYSGNWLVQKCATGIGIFLTGQIVAISQLMTDARPGTVAQPVLDSMIVLYAAASFVLALLAAYWLGRFPISREQHEARVAKMAAAPPVVAHADDPAVPRRPMG
ncbi:putative xylose-proton symporter [Alteripontixanthobacter maritimus]|uniref:Putative xylose-proton symporter n=1 Tax=Alteripontixanthobacter maritimus TaxID=2161824 RepID=A0A369QEF6_9SPHN|nr:MFS transporter [Alteripontixanthobacter maritimus]RDC60668.1 putative xylose-proton symporter [Alteripontixanthobacter maritimus]